MEAVNRLIKEIKTDSNVCRSSDRRRDGAGVGPAQFFTCVNRP
jgi:hypothetical protein